MPGDDAATCRQIAMGLQPHVQHAATGELVRSKHRDKPRQRTAAHHAACHIATARPEPEAQ
jgi:hypothetical protein